MGISDWSQIHSHILQLEQEGLVTRTFRRLDPERQQIILGAILDEAVERGPTSLNIKKVAERANISVGSLYTYFGSRDGLLAFTVELSSRFIQDMFATFRPMLAAMPIRKALTAYLEGGVAWSQTQMGLLQFFMRAAYHGESDLQENIVRPIAITMRETVYEILRQAVVRGEIRDDVDIEATTRIINALMIAVGDSQLLPYLNTYFQVYDEEMPPEKITEAMLTLILKGIS